jgi:hypothetical protein
MRGISLQKLVMTLLEEAMQEHQAPERQRRLTPTP